MSGAGRRLGLGDEGRMTGPGRRGREAGRPGGRARERPPAERPEAFAKLLQYSGLGSATWTTE